MTTKLDELRALKKSGLGVIEWEDFCALIAAVEALQKVVKVSDQFVQDTGLKHGDPLTDAVDEARAALAPFGE